MKLATAGRIARGLARAWLEYRLQAIHGINLPRFLRRRQLWFHCQALIASLLSRL